MLMLLQGPSGGQKGEKGEPGEAGKRVSTTEKAGPRDFELPNDL